MSALEETLNKIPTGLAEETEAKISVLSKFTDLISSVRFGIILLILLLLACLVGMLIMQQNVSGFERYFAELTPSQRLVYGSLGLFDIYHAWYFNGILALLSINIVLSSLERFPKTWKFVSQPKVDATNKWLRGQNPTESIVFSGTKEDVADRLAAAYRKAGWRKIVISQKKKQTFVFGQSGVWNRLGAYPVHVALLTIFLGGFLTSQLGFTGQMPLTPGQISNQISETVFQLDQVKDVNKTLPFTVICTDLEQKLIKKDGSIEAGNTIDWLTRVQIKDEYGLHEGVVQMNSPLDYRGYRFFQSSFLPMGKARSVTLQLHDTNNQTQNVMLKRDGSATLADGTMIKLVDFRANFSMSKENPNENSTDYQNPAAILEVTPVTGSTQTAYAFGEKLKGIPIASKPIGGYTFQLVDFEKVSEQHILSVQRDPGATVVYIGFTLLFLTLVAVFFFSHQRVWSVIEKGAEDTFKITVGGNTNRNQIAFEEKFKRFTAELIKL
jgi:cytochrome c biogenesis protein